MINYKIFKYVILEAGIDDMRDMFQTTHDVHPETFNHLYHNALPDANKSLGDMEWIASQHVKGNIDPENHEHIKSIMTEFAKPAIKNLLQKKRANQYKTFDELENAVKPHIGTAPTQAEQIDKDTKTIYQSPTHIIRQHLSHASAVKGASIDKNNPHSAELGGKCTWCVSADSEEGKLTHDTYTEQGTIPFYTIEHTDKHPTMPNRKFALLADPERDLHTHEFRNEGQKTPVNLMDYVIKNNSIMNTEPGKYIGNLVNYDRKNRSFSFKDFKGEHNIQYNDDNSYTNTTKSYEGNLTTTPYNSNGEIQGVMKSYNPDKTMDSEITYKNGLRDGILRRFSEHAPNRVILTRNYKDDKMHGDEITYSDPRTGHDIPQQITAINSFNNGKIQNEKLFHSNGNLHIEHNYKNDKLHGISHTYHENGKLKSETLYDNGRIVGEQKVYHENENPARTHNSYFRKMIEG